MHKRVLGACRASQYGARWGLQFQNEDRWYFLMDWWFAAAPDVAASWIEISDKWEWYHERLRRMMLARHFSHYVWAVHVHDMLHRSADVRFRPGVRVNLVRNSYPRLKWKLGTQAPLGEYITDAMGNCPVLVTNRTKRVLDSHQLMATPVDPSSDFGANFTPAFLPMAEQCAVARLAEPIICCGAPMRHCGRQVCPSSYVYKHFEKAANSAADMAMTRQAESVAQAAAKARAAIETKL